MIYLFIYFFCFKSICTVFSIQYSKEFHPPTGATVSSFQVSDVVCRRI